MHQVDPHLIVIFGGTGDLARRKLLPSLFNLLYRRGLKDRCYVLGVARRKGSDADYRQFADDAIREFGDVSRGSKSWCREHVYYHSLGGGTHSDYAGLKEKVEGIEKRRGLTGNRIHYLALPPETLEDSVTNLGKADLHRSSGYTRLVVEKPFGKDLTSAAELNNGIHRYFDEASVYRLDHYLGKETVQNIMVFRFANGLFESMWNREKIQHIEILVAEELGIGDRAGYYDGVGAIRDMVQNHLTQLLTLIAMEVPVAYDAESIRHEKLKVLRSVRPVTAKDVTLGQYTAGRLNGQQVPGYMDANGVSKDSKTETYVSVRLFVDNWRWQGVPFTLTTGKRLPERRTTLSVTFRLPPVCLFGEFDACRFAPNRLEINLQPNEGFSLGFEVKKPGDTFALTTEKLSFSYAEVFGKIPEAYETLLYDVMRGDHTLFVHADEVEKAWEIYSPILDRKPDPRPYAAGTWGPV